MKNILILLITALPYFVLSGTERPGRIFQSQPKQTDFSVFSNPANGSVKIIFDAAYPGTGYISLFSEAGNLLSRKRVDVLGGRNQWKQNLPAAGSSKCLVVFNMDSIERKVTVFRAVKN